MNFRRIRTVGDAYSDFYNQASSISSSMLQAGSDPDATVPSVADILDLAGTSLYNAPSYALGYVSTGIQTALDPVTSSLSDFETGIQSSVTSAETVFIYGILAVVGVIVLVDL